MISGFKPEMIRANVDPCEAAAIPCNGGIVAFVNRSVIGLGASALDPDAVALIFEIKRRSRFDSQLVHGSSVAHNRHLDGIVAVKVPDIGVGLAINDRLRRAADKPSDAAWKDAT